MGKSHDNQNFPTSTKILKDASDFSKNNTAMPYLYKDGKLLNGSIESYILPHLEPSGAILSTANDMARWLKFHLSMGKTESGQQLLNKELLQEAPVVWHRGSWKSARVPKTVADRCNVLGRFRRSRN